MTQTPNTLFSMKPKAWTKISTEVNKQLTSAEAIEAAGLDFEVIKTPNYIRTGNNDYVTDFVPTKKSFSTVRTDTGAILSGKVGDGYTVVQNRDAFKFFDAIVGEGEAIYESAGVMNGGEKIFIAAKLPSYISVAGNDNIEKYLLLISSHDGSTGVQAMFIPFRIACTNMLARAYGNAKQKIQIRHTANVHNALERAHEILGITNMLSRELEVVFNQMAAAKVSDTDVRDYVQKLVMPGLKVDAEAGKRQIDTFNSCLSYYHDGIGQQEIKGTVWGAYNAVTGYFQNVKSFKSDEQKMKNNLFGGNANIMHNAFVLAKEYSN